MKRIWDGHSTWIARSLTKPSRRSVSKASKEAARWVWSWNGSLVPMVVEWWFNSGLMGASLVRNIGYLWIIYGSFPLVNWQFAMERSTISKLGKSTINRHFLIAILNYQRVWICFGHIGALNVLLQIPFLRLQERASLKFAWMFENWTLTLEYSRQDIVKFRKQGE